MLLLRDQTADDPLVVVLSPPEAEAKSSFNSPAPPPPPPPATMRVRVAEPSPAEFEAEIVTADVPAAVGVPEISPVDVFTDKPAGRPVALNEVGLLLAAIW